MRFMKKRAESAPSTQTPTEAAPTASEPLPTWEPPAWVPPAPGPAATVEQGAADVTDEVAPLVPILEPEQDVHEANPDAVNTDDGVVAVEDVEGEVGEAVAEATALIPMPVVVPHRHLTEHTYTAHAVAKAVGYHGLSIIPGSRDLSLSMNGETSSSWVDAQEERDRAPEVDLDEVLTNATMRLVTVPDTLIFEDLVAEFGYRPTFVTPVAVETVPESAEVSMHSEQMSEHTEVDGDDDTSYPESEQAEAEHAPEDEHADGAQAEAEQAPEDEHADEPEQAEGEQAEGEQAEAEHADGAQAEAEQAPEDEHADEPEPVWENTELSEPSQAEREALAALVSDLRSFSDLPSTPPMPPIEGEPSPRQD
jgi:hypothetical protein